MDSKKTILIGSDQLSSLSQILKFVKRIPEYNYISATDQTNVLEMMELISPKLLVLRFNNFQNLLQNLRPAVEQSRVPILCLCKREEEIVWSKNSIVFRQDFEQSLKENKLSQIINSILLLQNQNSNNLSLQSSLFTEQNAALDAISERTPAYELELQQKVEALKKVKFLIKDLYDEVDDPVKNRLLSIANFIKVSISDEKHWEDFKIQFNDSYKGFIATLNIHHPQLTNRDIKYCCYLRIGMSNEDIRHVLGINQESVSTHKYRLKRKLHLNTRQNLRAYLNQLG